MIKFLTSPRIGRADFLFGVIGIAAVWIAAAYLLTGQLSLMLNLGIKSRIEQIGAQPVSITLLSLVCDLLLFWFVIRRLRDGGFSGWLSLGLLVLPLAGAFGGLLALGVLLALVFIPGTIGPNRFGPDPCGWNSREHFDEQQRHLKSGDI